MLQNTCTYQIACVYLHQQKQNEQLLNLKKNNYG